MWQYNNTNYLSHGHKYVAKIKINGKTRYFYTNAEYNAYLQNKRRNKDASDIEMNKEYQEAHKDDLFDSKTVYKSTSTDAKTGKTTETTSIYSSKGKITKSLEAGSKAVSEYAEKGKSFVKNLISAGSKKVNDTINKATDPVRKYIAKITINGKPRYFYTQAEYSAYLKNNRRKKDASDIKANKEYQEAHKDDLFDSKTVYKSTSTDAKTGKSTSNVRIYSSKGKINRTIENASNEASKAVSETIENASNEASKAVSEYAQKGSDYIKKLLGK